MCKIQRYYPEIANYQSVLTTRRHDWANAATTRTCTNTAESRGGYSDFRIHLESKHIRGQICGELSQEMTEAINFRKTWKYYINKK